MRALAFALSLFLAAGSSALAWADFEVPPQTGPVVDTAGMLSRQAHDEISVYLHKLYDSGGTQIQVALVPSLGGVSIEEAGIKLADHWKIGRKGEDTGVILLVAKTDRKVRIEVGKGREGDLPDVTANRIIREIISPSLREGNPDRAIASGVMAIAQRTDPKLAGVAADAEPEPRRPVLSGGLIRLILFIIVFLVLPLLFRGGGRGGGGFWYGGGGGGSWGGGSSDGGGWSGGGGGFSGGGSSGDW